MLKYCPECDKPLEVASRQYKNKVYCSKLCNKYFNRKKAALKKRLEKRKSNLRLNREFRYLVSQCRRANTIQILHGHNLASLIELMELLRNRPKGEVDLCHIYPVKGVFSVGLLHGRNVFYAGRHQNRKHGKKYMGGGMSLARTKLDPYWAISSTMTSDEILVKIEEYLHDILPKYLEMCGVRKSRKVALVEKIRSLDPSYAFDTLMDVDSKSLAEQWARMTYTRPFIIPVSRESKYIAYLDGLTRFINYNLENQKALNSVRKTMMLGYIALEKNKQSLTFNVDFNDRFGTLIPSRYLTAEFKDPDCWSEFKDFIYDTAFAALSGATVDFKEFRRKIKRYLRFDRPHPVDSPS